VDRLANEYHRHLGDISRFNWREIRLPSTGPGPCAERRGLARRAMVTQRRRSNRWRITGQVQDNGGTPLQGAEITTSPASYGSLCQLPRWFLPCIRRRGCRELCGYRGQGWLYGSLPQTIFPAEEDARLDPVLAASRQCGCQWGVRGGAARRLGSGRRSRPHPLRLCTAYRSARRAATRGRSILHGRKPIYHNCLGKVGYGCGRRREWRAARGVGRNRSERQTGLGIRYAQRTPAGTWSQPEVLTAGPKQLLRQSCDRFHRQRIRRMVRERHP